MMRTCLATTTGIFLFLSVSVMSALQDMPVVREIQIVNTGAGALDDSFVRAHTGVKTGEKLNRAAISKDVKKLLETGRFSSVTVQAEAMGDDIRLVYSFQNKLRLIAPIDIKGSDHFRQKKIRNLLGIRTGDLVDDQTLEVAGRNVIKEYQQDYFSDIKLTWALTETDHAEGLAKVELLVDEGEKARVRKMVFEGNSRIETSALEKLMKQRAKWDPRYLFRKKRYTAEELESARLQIRDYYKNEGFLNVKVDEPSVELDGNKDLVVVVNVVEGEKYKIGNINLAGVSLFPEEELQKLVFLKAGDTASQKSIDELNQSLSDYYGARGYMDTTVDMAYVPDESTGEMNLGIKFKEGQLTKIRNVIIKGNTRTKDKVIRRELLVSPGDIYNSVKVRRSKTIVSNLDYFGMVRDRPLSTPIPDQKDLLFEVEEKPTGNLMMGAGFSSIDKVMGFAELSQGNFDIGNWPPTGGGQKLKMRAQVGSRRKEYELSVMEPWFLDRKLSLGCDLYRSEISSSDYAIDRTGGALSLGKKLPGPNRVTVRYKLERVSSITDTNQYYYLGSDEGVDFMEDKRNQSSLDVTFTYNTCNHPFVPTRGTRASLFGSIAGGPLGFDTDIYGVGASVNHYIPLWRGHVFSMRGRYEVVDSYGDTDEVPYSERLFAGGGRTIRGFDYRDVGPKVLLNQNSSDGYYRAYGGSSLALGSLGYTIPITTGLRWAFFYDVGNVWREAFDFDQNHLASSAGVGIRLDVPGFPIRLDRAWVIKKDNDITKTDSWAIWIGHDF